MSRPPNIVRSRKLTVMIPEDVMGRLEIFLTSDRTGKVPLGSYQQFFVERINEFFGKMEGRRALHTEMSLETLHQEVVEASADRTIVFHSKAGPDLIRPTGKESK